MLLTHAYALWAANVLLAVFAPAFPLSLLRQEIRPQAAQAHSVPRSRTSVKSKVLHAVIKMVESSCKDDPPQALYRRGLQTT